ncbi:MAG: HEAT repeat domain-containing protein [Planctomycetes bacterium]|nr:HEAT repeat domain-containing protein [Planctomycetota bacterium]
MKNTSKRTIRRKRSVFIFYMLFSVLSLIVFSGCNEGAMTSATNSPETINISELLPKAREIISAGLSDSNPNMRTISIEVIADTKQMKFMPKVQRLLQDEFVHVRFLAALAIGDVQYSLAEGDVSQLLKDEDENARIAAAYALVKLGHTEKIDILRKAIASSNQTVRANAALLLGKTGDRNSLKFLYWALRHKDSEDKVKFQAVEAIAKIGDERIYPKLWAMLRNVYADDRVTGARGMGALGTTNARNVLLTILDDDVPEVRLAAAEQLGMLGDTSGEPEVLEVLKKNAFTGLSKEDDERLKTRAALAIGRIGTSSVTKYLPGLLENKSNLVRIAAAKAVFQSVTKQ